MQEPGVNRDGEITVSIYLVLENTEYVAQIVITDIESLNDQDDTFKKADSTDDRDDEYGDDHDAIKKIGMQLDKKSLFLNYWFLSDKNMS